MSETTRRLAAIMFTDMVGYTAMGQRNESLSLAMVDEQRKIIRPIVTRHNGREVKTIGDAFMVEFPSALDAVRCAFDIQRAIREYDISLPEDRRVHLRVGVHLGDVVESGGDISGDAVNVASRIEPLAEDGGVCLSRQVYDHVHNKFELPMESMGTRNLKNVAAPTEVFKLVMPWTRGHQQDSFERRRVAVLPFANMSSNSEDTYFADGMTEELITVLSGVSELTVIARTSTMKYRGSPKGASEIGKDLSVGSLVEGSVRKAGNKVRITVQLIDTKNEGHLWAQNYDRQMDDIFAIQTDVAQQVAGALQVKLVGSEKKRLERLPTSNIEAYTLYLKGRYYLDKEFGKEEGFKKAIAHFEEAVANDPNFAQAFAALAFCYQQLGFFGLMGSKEAGMKAEEFVDKALTLDDALAEAHQAKGRILRNYDWDFQGAKREFERAIELNPSYSAAYGGLAQIFLFNHEGEAAVEIADKGLELDPMGDGLGMAATVRLYNRNFERAALLFERLLEINPDSPYAKGNLGLALINLGQFEKGLDYVRAGAKMAGPAAQSDLAYALARTGKVDELRQFLVKLQTAAAKNPELSVAVASACANLGDADGAIEWLERAFDDHLAYLVSVNKELVFDSIRPDARFQSLMKRIGWTKTMPDSA